MEEIHSLIEETYILFNKSVVLLSLASEVGDGLREGTVLGDSLFDRVSQTVDQS